MAGGCGGRWRGTPLVAVKELEDAGIVHRDIKPEDIVFDEDGKPVLL